MGLGTRVVVIFEGKAQAGKIVGWKDVRGETRWEVELDGIGTIETFDVHLAHP